MPSNLETLELTLTSNSTSAKEGIETLVSSLTSLSSAVERSCSGVARLNKELRELKGFENIKLPNLSNLTGASSVQKGALQYAQTKKLLNEMKSDKTGAAISKEEAISMLNMSKAELTMQKAQNMAASFVNKAQEGASKEELTNQALQIKTITQQYEHLADAENGSAKSSKENVSTLGKLKEGFGEAGKSALKFGSRVRRIATTMLIRSAIRAMIKDIKEGVNNVYEWSKLNNGAFAKSLDSLKNKSGELKNSFGAAISPAIQAAIPLINTLASAAINALNWVNQLISLLTGKNSWTKATEGVHDYAKELGKAGGAASSWLAKFDELNVMSGGGGGGGGTAKVDYSDMFEEVYKYDDEIKEVANFLKENAETIKAAAIATGVAILGWKLSNAFAETLPKLSNIAGLIGVGATITITLLANWALTNQYLKTKKDGWLYASLLTTALGTTAAAVIANKLFHGNAAAWTASFTLALTAVSDIVALIGNTDVKAFSKEGLLTSLKAGLEAGGAAGIALHFIGGLGGIPLLAAAGGVALFTFAVAVGLKLITQDNNIKWGNLNLTEAEIEKYVTQRMFKTQVNVVIDKINTIIDQKADIDQSVMYALGDIETQMNILSLGIDKAETYGNLAKFFSESEEGNLITKIKNLCDINIDMLKLTFASVELLDSKGNAFDADTLTKGIKGWEKVGKTMEDKGKELSDLLAKGAKGELTPKMEEYTQQLLEEVMGMSAKIASAKEFGEATVDFKEKALSAMSKGSFQGIMDAFKEYSGNYEETIRKALKENIASWYALADLEEDPALKAEYMRIANELQAGLEDTVAAELKKQTSPGIDLIKEWLFGNHGKGTAEVKWTEEYLREFIDSGSIADALKEILFESGFSNVELDIMDMIHFSGWEFLKDDMKKKFLKNVTIDESTIKELSQIGVSAMELVTIVDWNKVKNMEQNDFVKTITSAYGASGIAAIKHRFPQIKASDILTIVEWNSFSTSEQLNFLTALKEAFGAEAAKKAAKDAGIDIGKLVQEGMKSKDETIKKQAEEWSKIIKKGVEGETPNITPQISQSSVTQIPKKIKDIINGQDYFAYVTTKFNNGSPQNIKDGIDGIKGKDVPIRVTFENGYGPVQSIENALKNFTPKAKVEAELTNASTLRSQLKSALSMEIKLDTGSQTMFKMKLSAKAGGGLVNSGDMFIANENGVPEMIGRFGNQTGVANTDQIVTGISRGVAQANESQNNLLREQNNLLLRILRKDTSVRIGASAGLGRTVKQSLEMLSTATGG